ncbi:unnamed protein product [Heligmosomoides polygyrus]|uniref:Transposase n=1 Tax=Heligmosomoides polygyrus TaxID=6339 RepID=A0A183GL00_HELPZ|nr:unnamed protein product [Heligmosomoides polygyrus]
MSRTASQGENAALPTLNSSRNLQLKDWRESLMDETGKSYTVRKTMTVLDSRHKMRNCRVRKKQHAGADGAVM